MNRSLDISIPRYPADGGYSLSTSGADTSGSQISQDLPSVGGPKQFGSDPYEVQIERFATTLPVQLHVAPDQDQWNDALERRFRQLSSSRDRHDIGDSDARELQQLETIRDRLLSMVPAEKFIEKKLRDEAIDRMIRALSDYVCLTRKTEGGSTSNA